MCIRDRKNDEIEELSESLAKLEKQAEEEQKRYADLTGRSESLAKRLTELSISKNVILKDIELKTTQVGQLNNEKSGMLGGNRDRQNEIEELRKNIEEFKEKAERLKEDEMCIRDSASAVSLNIQPNILSIVSALNLLRKL